MIRKIFLPLLSFLLVFTSVKAFCPVGGFWIPSAEVDGKIGSFRKGAGITLFSPVCQNPDSLVFWQTTFGNYRKIWTGNLGLGYRRLITPWAAFGINGFADVGYSEASRTYGQLGFGGELLGRCWEARLNGYIPTTRRTCVHQYPGGADTYIREGTRAFFSNLHNCRVVERSYKGFDAEAGYSLCLWRGQLWGYGGYYWFADRGTRTINGPRVRLEYHLFDLFRTRGTRVVIGGEWSYDYLHGNQGSVVASLRIPLCGFKPGCALDIRPCQIPTLCQRMNNRVMREPAMWVDRTREDEHYDAPVVGPLTGQVRHLYCVSQDGGGDGSLERPLGLSDAMSLAGPEDIIFVLGELHVEGSLQLGYGQILMGSGGESEIPLNFFEYGVYTINEGGEPLPPALLKGDGVHSVVSLAHHSHVRDVQINARGGPNAIFGTDVQNVRLSNGQIENTSSEGIRLIHAVNPLIYHFRFRDIEGAALHVDGENVVLRDLTLDRVEGDGIRVDGGNGVLIEKVKASALQGHAVKGTETKGLILRDIGEKANPHTLLLENVTDYAIHDSYLTPPEPASQGWIGRYMFQRLPNKPTLTLSNCSGYGCIKNSTFTGHDNRVISIQNNQSQLQFAGSNSLDAHGVGALEIIGSTGAIDAKALAIAFTGDTAGSLPLSVAKATNVELGPVVLTRAGETTLCPCVGLADANVSFESLFIANGCGHGLVANGGSVSIAGGSIGVVNGLALDLAHVEGAITLGTLVSQGSKEPNFSLRLRDYNGSFIATDVDFDTSVLFDGGSGSLALSGQIIGWPGGPLRERASHILEIRNLSEKASASFYGAAEKYVLKEEAKQKEHSELAADDYVTIPLKGIYSDGAVGVLIDNCAGSVWIEGANLIGGRDPAIWIHNSTGKVTLVNSRLASSLWWPSEVVQISDASYFVMRGCVVTATSSSLKHAIAYKLRGGAQMPTPQTEGEEPIPRTLILQNNTFHNIDRLQDVVNVEVNGVPGKTQAFIIGNDTRDAPLPYAFYAKDQEGGLAVVLRDNVGARQSEEPITVKLTQEGQGRTMVDLKAMGQNPDLALSRLEIQGHVDHLWTPPPLPEKDAAITNVPFFMMQQPS